jgi:hypothetical protein
MAHTQSTQRFYTGNPQPGKPFFYLSHTHYNVVQIFVLPQGTESPITDELLFTLVLPAMLLVYVTCLHMATVLGSYRDFGVFNVDVRTSPKLAILRFPTRLFHASPPGSAPGPRDHHPVTTTLPLVGVSGFACQNACAYGIPDSSNPDSPMAPTLYSCLSEYRVSRFQHVRVSHLRKLRFSDPRLLGIS